MTRLIGSLAVVVALVALPMAVRAEQGATPAKTQPKTLSAMGTVTAVTTDSLTVKNKAESWTFTIDKTTSVNAKGATHKSLELKKEGKASKLTEFVTDVRERFEQAARMNEAPVLLTSAAARPFVRQIVDRFRPQTAVMSQAEVHPRVRLKTVGSV